LDRVADGERIVIERRGQPAVVLVPPHADAASGARPAPVGFASLAGALADLPELDEILSDVAAARQGRRIVLVPTSAGRCTASTPTC
jgi:antitoxin (DNA-binding transcriptional repressor) of toxin-antitoxin stability system